MSGNVKGTIYAVTGGVFWAVSSVWGKILFNKYGFNAVWLVTLRLLSGGIIMLLPCIVAKGRRVCDVWKKPANAFRLIVFCLFGLTMAQMSYYLTVQYANPGTATVLQYTAPILILLIALSSERRLPRVYEAVIVLIAVTGVYLMTTHGNPGELAITWKALICGLLSSVGCAVYTIVPRSIIRKFGVLEMTGWAMSIGGVLAAVSTRAWNVPGVWNTHSVLMLIGVVLIGNVAAFPLYFKGVRLIGPVKGNLCACVEPLVATLLTAVTLRQSFTAADIAGMAMIIIGITVLTVKGSSTEQKE